MTVDYNPIARTFGQLRAVLVERLDLARHEVRPSTLLETIIPESERGEVWRELRRRGIGVPPLELSERERRLEGWFGLVVLISLVSAWWFSFSLVLTIITAVVLGGNSRRRTVEIPWGIRTVGELAVCATDFAAHKESGYRWTYNEIALKVRLTIADSQGLSLEDVRPECSLMKLGAE